MGLDTRGFADGALAGFQAMSQHLGAKEDRAYRLAQAEKADQRYEDDKNYRLDRDKVADERWKAESEANKKLRGKQEKAAEAQTKAAKIQGEAAEWAFNNEKAKPLAISLLQKASTGDFSMLTTENRQRLKGTLFDLDHLLDPERIQSVDRVFNSIQQVVANPKSVNQVSNDPQFIRDLGRTFAQDIKIGIGEVDPGTGKVIADKELEHINLSPTGSGNLVMGLKVTYEDGTTASKPLTQGHSAQNSDSILEIPIDKFLGDVHGRYRISKMIAGSDLVSHYGSLLGTKDGSKEVAKEYRAEMSKIDEWFFDAENDIRSQIGAKPEQIQQQLDTLKQQYQTRQHQTGLRFGMIKQEKDNGAPINTAFTEKVTQWASQDPRRQAFLSSMPDHIDKSRVNVDSLNDTFLAWMKTQHTETDAMLARRQLNTMRGIVNETNEDALIETQLTNQPPQQPPISDGGPTLTTGKPHQPGLSSAPQLSGGGSPKQHFIETLTPLAQSAADELGIPAEVLLAQAALETGWGKSLVSSNGQSSNNLFNIKAHGWDGQSMNSKTHEFENGERVNVTDDFRAYESAADSFADFVAFLKSNPRYANALKHAKDGDVEKFVRGLQSAGYATDPQYAQKILSIYRDISGRNGLSDLA